MMERHDHMNPWADKLQDITLPGENSSWEAMEALLDGEMPVVKRGDGRRWVLLIILLLLLIGVCNCPGVRRWGADSVRSVGGRTESGEIESDTLRGEGKKGVIGESVIGGKKEGPGGENEIEGRKNEPAREDEANGGKITGAAGKEDVSGGMKNDAAGGNDAGRRTRSDGDTRNNGDTRYDAAKGKRNDVTGGERGEIIRRAGHGGDQGGRVVKRKENNVVRGRKKGKYNNMPEAAGENDHDHVGIDTVRVREATRVLDTARGRDTAMAKKEDRRTDSVAKKPVRRADSTVTAKAAAKTSKADSVLQVKGWLAGIGLNQFFTVGQQAHSNFNSSGTTGGISDYIPIPMVRYYFSRKLFVQMEAQFNTPQYTSKDLLANVSKPDTNLLTGKIQQSRLYIQKLFYFNLPLSVHYSPIPNLYLGAGVQYARLTNGVALYADSFRRIFSSNPDSVISSKVLSFKNDTTYQKLKTNEFRLLVDIDYNFRRWIVGVRYNRALSNFINLQLYNNQITQSRNSSFQIYLRYIIWDGRKKKLLPK